MAAVGQTLSPDRELGGRVAFHLPPLTPLLRGQGQCCWETMAIVGDRGWWQMGGHTASSRQLPELGACFIIRSFQEPRLHTTGGRGHPMSLLSSLTPARPPVPQKAPSPSPFLSAGSILSLLPLRQAPPLLRAPRRPDAHSPSSPRVFPAQLGPEACPVFFHPGGFCSPLST